MSDHLETVPDNLVDDALRLQAELTGVVNEQANHRRGDAGMHAAEKLVRKDLDDALKAMTKDDRAEFMRVINDRKGE